MPTTTKTPTARDQRRDAKKAVADAGRAAKEAKKLEKSLKGANRARFEAVAAAALADVERARADVGTRPLRAARAARTVTARLEKASIRATASGDARRRDLAKSAEQEAKGKKDTKARAKAIKRRRAQSKMANKMAKKVALRSLITSVATPTDAEQRKKDRKLVRRLLKRAG